MSLVPKLHDDEVDISSALVARLLSSQFPDLAGGPIQVVASSGTDNVTFRVGSELAVRLPRTESTQGQVEKDLTWMPRLSPHLPLAIPSPLALGAPDFGYPFSWGVYRWLPGEVFKFDFLADPLAAARELAFFVRCLQEIPTDGAPVPSGDPFERGTPLAPRDALFREALDELRDEFDTGLVLTAWEASLAADTWTGPDQWIHGDLMPGNVLTVDGKLSAVIDFGTARAADPAADLLAAWYLFDGESRRVFREAMQADDETWVRARGWVLSLTLIALPYYRTRNPAAVADSHSFIDTLLADFTGD